MGGVEQDPRHIDDGADGADDEHYLEVEAAEELLQLRERVEQAARLTSCPAMRLTMPMVSPASFSSTVPTTSPCWTGAQT